MDQYYINNKQNLSRFQLMQKFKRFFFNCFAKTEQLTTGNNTEYVPICSTIQAGREVCYDTGL